MRHILTLGFLFLFSCTRQHYWSNEKIHSNYEKFSYSKIIFRAGDPVRGIDVEFVQTANYLKTYLLIHSIAVPCSKKSSKKILVKLECDNMLTTCEADILEGGQQFLLSDKIGQWLIESFLAKKNVIISIPGYRSTVTGEGFSQHFLKIERSFLENPFHLPF